MEKWNNGGYTSKNLPINQHSQIHYPNIPLFLHSNIQFTDEEVQSEVNKALERNFQMIKPDSDFIKFTIESEKEDARATVQYTIPTPAWKSTYRLRDTKEGKYELEGLALVDNNTDEDWNDFILSVVTGRPITFETDIGESLQIRN